MAELPELHVPRPYAQPSAHLAERLQVHTPDGACIVAFCYAPKDTAEVCVNAAIPAAFPVLMLHGNGEEHGIFGILIDVLVACGRTVIAVDSRAQGASTRGSAPLSYERMAHDALRVLDAAAVTKAHVLGVSDGAIEGLLLARDHADRIASLTALGANLSPDGLPGNDDIKQAAQAFAAWGREGDETTHYSDGTPAPTRAQARRTAELLYLMVKEPHINPASLVAISCPTCIMAGEFDDIPLRETRRIARAISGAREVIVKGADHTLPKVAPEAVLRELLISIAAAE
jgi:pimeloyl-ACP methyl ester carboxylesterase